RQTSVPNIPFPVRVKEVFRLLLKFRRKLVEGKAEDIPWIWRREIFLFMDGLLHFLLGLRTDPLIVRLIPEAFLLHILLQPFDGILLSPLLHFFAAPVPAGIVRRRMVAQAVSYAFDQGWSLSISCLVERFVGRFVNSEGIIAIDLNSREAVGDGLLGQCFSCGLSFKWNGDSPLVVLTYKDHRHGEDAGEI